MEFRLQTAVVPAYGATPASPRARPEGLAVLPLRGTGSLLDGTLRPGTDEPSFYCDLAVAGASTAFLRFAGEAMPVCDLAPEEGPSTALAAADFPRARPLWTGLLTRPLELCVASHRGGEVVVTYTVGILRDPDAHIRATQIASRGRLPTLHYVNNAWEVNELLLERGVLRPGFWGA